MKKMVIFQIVLFTLLFIFLLFLLFSSKSNFLPSTKVTLENTTIAESTLLLARSLL